MEIESELRRISRPFAEAVVPLAAALGKTQPRSADWGPLSGALQHVIRKCHDRQVKSHAPAGWSTAAAEVAHSLGADIRILTWHGQPKYDPGRKRLHLDHVFPVSTVIATCVGDPRVEHVLDTLTRYRHVLWITKDENARLDDAGFKSCRPDPQAAYRKVAIHVDPWPELT